MPTPLGKNELVKNNVPAPPRTTLAFVYKRVSDFYAIENIANVLNTYFGPFMSQGSNAQHDVVLEDAVMRIFSLPRAEARRRLEEIRQMRSMGRGAATRNLRRRTPLLPRAVLSLAATGEISVRLEGIDCARTHRAVMTVVGFLSYYSDARHVRQVRRPIVLPKGALSTPTPTPAHSRTRSPTTSTPTPTGNNAYDGDEDEIIGLDDDDLMMMDDEDADRDDADIIGSEDLSGATFSGKAFQKYALKSLQRADPKVFDAAYSRACQKSASRQPIVVSKTELERIDAAYPGSYFGNHIANFGSDRDKRARNIYICPEYWCPLTRVSMTEAQLKSAGGRCPHPNEPVMHIDNKYFHSKRGEEGKSISSKSRIASFTKGTCYPCCFAPTSGETTGSHTSRISKCAEPNGNGQSAASMTNKETDETMERYVKGQQPPLETRRYGALPEDATRVLPAMRPPAGGAAGTGNIGPGTDCLVRIGVGDGSFVRSAELVLQDAGFGRVDLVDLISTHLTVETFMTINGGRLLRMFVNDARMASRSALSRFHKWMTQTDAGKQHVKAFGLRNAVRAVAAAIDPPKETNGRKGCDNAHEYKRAFVMWSAHDTFMAYLRDRDAWKSEVALLDLLNNTALMSSWLKADGGTMPPHFIVCDVDPAAASLTSPTAAAAVGRGGGMSVVIGGGEATTKHYQTQPFAIMLKQNQYYEPLCRVRWQPKSGGTVNVSTTFKPGTYAAADAVHTFYVSERSKRHISLPRHTVHTAQPRSKFVLDHNFKVVGVLSNDGRFHQRGIPTPESGVSYIFNDQLPAKAAATSAVARAIDERNIFVRCRVDDVREVYQRHRARSSRAICSLVALVAQHRDAAEAATRQMQFFDRKAEVKKVVCGVIASSRRAQHIASSVADIGVTKERLVDEVTMAIMLRRPTVLPGNHPMSTRKSPSPQATPSSTPQEDTPVTDASQLVFDQAFVDSGRLWQDFGSLANKYIKYIPGLTGSTHGLTSSPADKTRASTPRSPTPRKGTRRG